MTSGKDAPRGFVQDVLKLRRYARVLCGSQNVADEAVEKVLKLIADQPALLLQAGDSQTSLFRAFSRHWSSDANGRLAQDILSVSGETGVDQSLALITPQARQAFLLTSLEGFELPKVAQILDQTIEGVDRLVAQARQEIASQTETTVLIIEDEFFIAMQIEQVVKDLGHHVMGVARTRAEALQAFKEMQGNLMQPGIVLADIQLADGSSGIDAVNDILSIVTIPTIFITAFPERLLTGRKLEPTYLLNKPFTEESLRALITQVLFFRASGPASLTNAN
jgi:CheY-like chemotaxis protein